MLIEPASPPHAATVRLDCTPDRAAMSITDDGSGFDTAQIPPDHLGLGIMRERADDIGAAITIDSKPGFGTQIEICWRKDIP